MLFTLSGRALRQSTIRVWGNTAGVTIAALLLIAPYDVATR
jgi:hypothetical protein